MRLFSEFVAWQNYAATEFAVAEVQEARAEAKVRYEENKALLSSWNDATDKVTIAKAAQSLSPDVEEARQAHLVAYAHRKMTHVMVTNAERCAQLISRELSRRIGGVNAIERRQMRWNP